MCSPVFLDLKGVFINSFSLKIQQHRHMFRMQKKHFHLTRGADCAGDTTSGTCMGVCLQTIMHAWFGMEKII